MVPFNLRIKKREFGKLKYKKFKPIQAYAFHRTQTINFSAMDK